MLGSSLRAVLLWAYLGTDVTKWWLMGESRQRSDRVGSGIAMGVLVLLCEAVGFLAWVLFS
jgi:hypothetical protein